MNRRGEYGSSGGLYNGHNSHGRGGWTAYLGADPFDAARAFQQIDAEMEVIVDALYRAMGVDPAAIRKPTIADPAWQQRVVAARAKAQQSPLWAYWEASVSPKYDDWRAARQAFATRPMTVEDYDRWLARVGQLRSEVKGKGVKLETPDPISMMQPQAAPGDTGKLLKWGAIGALAIGGVALLVGLASSTKAARAPYERYRYGYLSAR